MANQIRDWSNDYTETYGGSPYLADFMLTTAFRESNFIPDVDAWDTGVETKTRENSARGLFGMRPVTALKDAFGQVDSDVLLDPATSFVLAIRHIQQAQNYGATDWASIRRYWGYPSKADEPTGTWSKQSRSKFERAVADANRAYGLNIDVGFLDQPYGVGGYPGTKQMIERYGAYPIAGVL